jgi:hypothetical protein
MVPNDYSVIPCLDQLQRNRHVPVAEYREQATHHLGDPVEDSTEPDLGA